MTEYYDALTDARLAVWQAIDEYEDTAHLFKTTFRFGGESTLVTETAPSFSDLDSLWIMPMRAMPKWYVTTKQTFALGLAVVMYTKDWKLDTAEKNVLKIARAIHRAKPENGVIYTAPYAPQVGPNTSFQNIKIDDKNPIRAIKTTMEVVLRVHFQPHL